MPDLPELPAPIPAEELHHYPEGDLDRLGEELRLWERETLAAMAPFDRRLKEIRARVAELNTERRRRERQEQIQRRAAVRQAGKSGEMPNLATALAGALELPPQTSLQQLQAFLVTGGTVGLGFPTKPGVLSFTNGRSNQTATTWGEAQRLYDEGWQPGVAGIPGVRVHMLGTRTERVVSAEEVLVSGELP